MDVENMKGISTSSWHFWSLFSPDFELKNRRKSGNREWPVFWRRRHHVSADLDSRVVPSCSLPVYLHLAGMIKVKGCTWWFTWHNMIMICNLTDHWKWRQQPTRSCGWMDSLCDSLPVPRPLRLNPLEDLLKDPELTGRGWKNTELPFRWPVNNYEKLQ